MCRSSCRWPSSLYSQREAGVQFSCPRKLRFSSAAHDRRHLVLKPAFCHRYLTVPQLSWKLGWDSDAVIAPEAYAWASKSSPQPTCRQPPLHLKLNPAPQLGSFTWPWAPRAIWKACRASTWVRQRWQLVGRLPSRMSWGISLVT